MTLFNHNLGIQINEIKITNRLEELQWAGRDSFALVEALDWVVGLKLTQNELVIFRLAVFAQVTGA